MKSVTQKLALFYTELDAPASLQLLDSFQVKW